MGFWDFLKRKDAESIDSFFTTSNLYGSSQYGSMQAIAAWEVSPWFRAVVSKIASHCSAVKWHLYVETNKDGSFRMQKELDSAPFNERHKIMKTLIRKGELKLVENNPLMDLFNKPNDMMTGTAFRELMFIWLDIVGEAFQHKVSNGFGGSASLWPIVPAWVTKIPDSKKNYYEVNRGASVIHYEPDEMLFFRHLSPLDPYGRGSGLGSTCADEIETDESISKLVKTSFLNKGRPDMLIGVEGASKDVINRTKEEFNNNHRGFYNFGRAYWSNGKVTMKQITQSFAELETTKQRTWTRDLFIHVFGVPPEIVGVSEHSNKATSQVALEMMASEVVIPRLELYRETNQQQLIDPIDPRLILWYDDPTPQNRDDKLRAMKAAPWAPTRGEWREVQGLDHRGDVDDVHLTPGAASLFEEDERKEEEESDNTDNKKKILIAPVAKIDSYAVDNVLNQLRPEYLIDATVETHGEELVDWFNNLMGELGFEPSFNILNPVFTTHLAEFAGIRISLINETTREAIRQALLDGIRLGEGIKELSKRVSDQMSLATGYRTERIARTEVLRSSNYGTYQSHRISGVVSFRQWVATLGDSRTRASHLALNGKVVSINEPFTIQGFSAMHPGNFGVAAMDINCFLPGTKIEGSIIGGSKSYYSGEAIEIKTSLGNCIRITPNHPILTSVGWIKAKDLRQGHNLISYGDEIDSSLMIKNNVEQGPAVIEDVFTSLSDRFFPVRREGHAIDFHGDAKSFEGDINIVRPEGQLVRAFNSDRFYCRNHPSFVSPRSSSAFLSSNGSLLSLGKGMFSTPNTIPSGATLVDGLSSGHLRPFNPLCIGTAANLHSRFLKSGSEAGSSDPCLYADLLKRFSSDVLSDQVVEVRNFSFSGHVYDLQSSTGWTVAQGLIVSNCRCTTVAVIKYMKNADELAVVWKAYIEEADKWEDKLKAAFINGFEVQEKAMLKELNKWS